MAQINKLKRESHDYDKVKNLDPNVVLSEETRKRIDFWRAKFPADRQRSALIQALMAAQEQQGGYLTDELITAVTMVLDLPAAYGYEVATFYSMFDLKPTGKYKISVCTNISCMLCGADDIVKHVEKKLGCKTGETTADGKFTLKPEEECLAACVNAPMMMVNGHFHEHLTPEKVDQILDGLK
jgi:NADH-quinone oxidoreductase subunit E